jgi:hypothetical protein
MGNLHWTYSSSPSKGYFEFIRDSLYAYDPMTPAYAWNVDIYEHGNTQMMTFETGSVSIAWAIINELSSTYQKVCRAHEVAPDSHAWVHHYQRNFDIAPETALQELHSVDETGAAAAVLQDADVRREWITKQMRRREDEFAVLERAVVHVGTWNVNSKKTVCNTRLHTHMSISRMTHT